MGNHIGWGFDPLITIASLAFTIRPARITTSGALFIMYLCSSDGMGFLIYLYRCCGYWGDCFLTWLLFASISTYKGTLIPRVIAFATHFDRDIYL